VLCSHVTFFVEEKKTHGRKKGGKLANVHFSGEREKKSRPLPRLRRGEGTGGSERKGESLSSYQAKKKKETNPGRSVERKGGTNHLKKGGSSILRESPKGPKRTGPLLHLFLRGEKEGPNTANNFKKAGNRGGRRGGKTNLPPRRRKHPHKRQSLRRRGKKEQHSGGEGRRWRHLCSGQRH